MRPPPVQARTRIPRTRILFLIDYVTSYGGAERLAVALATHLPQDRFEPWLCATRWSDPIASQALADGGVRHLTLGRTGRWDAHRLARLVSLLRRHRFDILHTHKFGSNLWGSLIGTACRTPAIVVHEHGWAYEGDRARTWLDAHVIGRLATRFVTVSHADARRLISAEGVSAEKVVVIPNGYVPSPQTTDTDVRGELGIDAGAPVVAIAALLRPEKRIDLLLTAHAHVRRTLPGAQLLIAGGGPCQADLERQAAELRLDGSVHFLGIRTDVDSVLRAADAAVLCSDREGSPLLIFECMANGVPLVATEVGGIPDVVQDGRNGRLVPRGDAEALARALVGLLGDPEGRRRIAATSRKMLADYTVEATAARFAAMYDSLVAAPR